jgi:hypothetical protein
MGTGEKTLLQKLIIGNLAIANFHDYCQGLVEIFEEVRNDYRGQNATYIPELASVPPGKFGFAVCTGKFGKQVCVCMYVRAYYFWIERIHQRIPM